MGAVQPPEMGSLVGMMDGPLLGQFSGLSINNGGRRDPQSPGEEEVSPMTMGSAGPVGGLSSAAAAAAAGAGVRIARDMSVGKEESDLSSTLGSSPRVAGPIGGK